tara:strand:+ start:107 stop:469 length:363 start_codon:yes stop_codon:yes gene_type:complete
VLPFLGFGQVSHLTNQDFLNKMVDLVKDEMTFPQELGDGDTWDDYINENNQNLVYTYSTNLSRKKLELINKEQIFLNFKNTLHPIVINELSSRGINLIVRYYRSNTKNIVKEIVVYPQDW